MKNNKIDIANIIYSSPAPNGEVNFCNPKTINSFFTDIPDDVLELWPFDFQKEGYNTAFTDVSYNLKTNYSVMQERQTLSIAGICYNKNELYVFDGDYILNEEQQLCFYFKSLYKEKGINQRGFANIFIQKQRNFLSAYDQQRGLSFGEKPSEIRLLAASGHDTSGLPVKGGYIWAFLGMDFYSPLELHKCRKAFTDFLSKNTNIKLSTKDLKYFTKPCHFSMFDAGIKIKLAQNKEVGLGNAFMHQYSWRARWRTNTPQAEEQKFEIAFNAPALTSQIRLSNAFKVLNYSYRMILKKYYLKRLINKKLEAARLLKQRLKTGLLSVYHYKKVKN
ncbi:MAG: hypothetical protein E7017_05485 [Alphaproteobacteria bacterium]|nr:hypothetical protein [Alphaproteobacteria bacterium]